jgi:hypothetical protein
VKFKVVSLRNRGRRLPWSEARNGPWHVGDLVSRQVNQKRQRHNVLTLRPADPVVGSPIADLYEPVLVRFSLLAFRIRGFERVEGPQGPLLSCRSGTARTFDPVRFLLVLTPACLRGSPS